MLQLDICAFRIALPFASSHETVSLHQYLTIPNKTTCRSSTGESRFGSKPSSCNIGLNRFSGMFKCSSWSASRRYSARFCGVSSDTNVGMLACTEAAIWANWSTKWRKYLSLVPVVVARPSTADGAPLRTCSNCACRSNFVSSLLQLDCGLYSKISRFLGTVSDCYTVINSSNCSSSPSSPGGRLFTSAFHTLQMRHKHLPFIPIWQENSLAIGLLPSNASIHTTRSMYSWFSQSQTSIPSLVASLRQWLPPLAYSIINHGADHISKSLYQILNHLQWRCKVWCCKKMDIV